MILEAKNLCKKFGKHPVVNNFSFFVNKGEIVGLFGPNGAGKTTAFYLIIGLIKPDSGSVSFFDNDVTSFPIYKRAKIGMGYLTQEPSIFRQLTVEQNIMSILEMLDISKKERLIKLKELLEEFRLCDFAKRKAITLSGGERRRLEIARSLVTNPKLLLLDEPFANVDPITINEVKEIICHLKSKGISMLITDHNAKEIGSIIDRGYLMHGGEVMLSGTMAELLKNEYAKKSYFGDSCIT